MVERIAKISAEQGFLMTFAVITLALLCYIIHNAMKDWQKQKELEREERHMDREIAREQNDKYAQIIANQSTQIERSTSSIKGYQDELCKHTERSDASFKDIIGVLGDLDSKVRKIGDYSETLATKAMVEDVSEDIKFIRENLKK